MNRQLTNQYSFHLVNVRLIIPDVKRYDENREHLVCTRRKDKFNGCKHWYQKINSATRQGHMHREALTILQGADRLDRA
jgi:hypothetical protein